MQTKSVSAKSWILMDASTQAYLRGHQTDHKHQIASLTKMYTLYACLTLNDSLKVVPESTVVKTFDTSMTGTLAHIIPEQYIRLSDLYYGLMLPSGNDAACILAAYYGCWIVASTTQNRPPKAFRKESLGQNIKNYKLYIKKFIHYVNKIIVKELLNHKNTHFENPHGLPDKSQLSTVWQVAMASLHFSKNQQFAKIAGCISYRGNYYDSQSQFQWQNTNILLRQGYTGLKTGITVTAGGCLASLTSIPLTKYKYQQLLIVVVGSSGAQSRFSDTKEIVKDYQTYLNMMKI